MLELQFNEAAIKVLLLEHASLTIFYVPWSMVFYKNSSTFPRAIAFKPRDSEFFRIYLSLVIKGNSNIIDVAT
jgi:hypothetical protein